MQNWYFIYGPMFSGKTTTAINYIKNQTKPYSVIKHSFDTRYSSQQLATHSNIKLEQKNKTYIVDSDSFFNIADLLEKIVFIDEIQFFQTNILQKLLNKTVYFFGLDKDFKNQYFPISEELLKRVPANNKLHLKALCQCGNLAEYSCLKQGIETKKNILIGGSEKYKSTCLDCFKF